MDESSVNSVIEYILKHHKPEIEEKFKFSEDIDELHYVAQVTMMLMYLKGSEPTKVEVDIVCGCMLKAIEDAKKKILNIITIKTISHGLIEIALN